MSISKTLSSAVAAIAVAGSVGLAYAQTTSNDSSQPAANTAPTANTGMPSNNMPSSNMPSSNMPSNSMPSGNMPSSTTTDRTVAPSSDLQPKADRN